jgi:hypothetical protein
VARLRVSLARRRWSFAVAALLLLLGVVAARVHPTPVADGAPAWTLWLPRVGTAGVPLGVALAAALLRTALLDAFEEPRRRRSR